MNSSNVNDPYPELRAAGSEQNLLSRPDGSATFTQGLNYFYLHGLNNAGFDMFVKLSLT